MPSPVFLLALAISAGLGVVGGGALRWATGPQAWNLFTAAFLWTLIVAAGTTIGRFFIERLRRGNWRHGLWLAHVQSFPLTTVFLLVAALISAGAALTGFAVPVFYASTLAVAVTLSLLGVLTSPFIR